MCTEAPPLRVMLDVIGLDPIAGRLRCESAETRFTGWLELTSALEGALRAALADRETTETTEGEARG